MNPQSSEREVLLDFCKTLDPFTAVAPPPAVVALLERHQIDWQNSDPYALTKMLLILLDEGRFED